MTDRVRVAQEAMAAWRRVMGVAEPDDVDRDVALFRFTLTVEAVWKAAQAVLDESEGLAVGSPKSSVRASFRCGLIPADEVEAVIAALDDRNLALHAYTEPLANEIHARVPAHARALEAWLANLALRAGTP